MKRGLKPLPEQTAMDLTFKTIPSGRKDGIYLAQDIHETGTLANIHRLSTQLSNGISNVSPLKIRAGENHFVIPYNSHHYVECSPDGHTYFPLGTAGDFIGPKEYYFCLGRSLYFILSLKERPQKPRFSQLELFPDQRA